MDAKSHEKEQAGCPLRDEYLRATYSHLYYPDADGRQAAAQYAAGLKAQLFPHHWDNYLNPTHFRCFARTSLLLAVERTGFQEMTQLHSPIQYPDQAWHAATFDDGELLFTGRLRLSEILPPEVDPK